MALPSRSGMPPIALPCKPISLQISSAGVREMGELLFLAGIEHMASSRLP